MKKIMHSIRTLSIVAVALFSFAIAMEAYAGGECVLTQDGTSTTLVKEGKRTALGLVTITCTASASDGSMSDALSSEIMKALDGQLIYWLEAKPGGTAPTDASDFAITSARGATLLSATSNGLDFVDATTFTDTFTEDNDGNDFYQPVYRTDALTFTITNNSVNSAIVIFYLHMIDY